MLLWCPGEQAGTGTQSKKTIQKRTVRGTSSLSFWRPTSVRWQFPRLLLPPKSRCGYMSNVNQFAPPFGNRVISAIHRLWWLYCCTLCHFLDGMVVAQWTEPASIQRQTTHVSVNNLAYSPIQDHYQGNKIALSSACLPDCLWNSEEDNELLGWMAEAPTGMDTMKVSWVMAGHNLSAKRRYRGAKT